MRKILLSAGHSETAGRDRGAQGNGFIEGEEAAKIRRAVYDQLKAFGADVHRDPDNTILADSLKNFRAITDSGSILLDIHFNSAVIKTATGVETFVENNPTPGEKKLAQALSKAVGSTLGIQLRGTAGVRLEKDSQHSGGLGWMRMPGINVLLEVCFISNPNDMKSYSKNFLSLCCAIANVLWEFAKEGCEEKSQPVYIVRSGDSISKIAAKHEMSIAKLKALNGLKSDLIHPGDKLFVV